MNCEWVRRHFIDEMNGCKFKGSRGCDPLGLRGGLGLVDARGCDPLGLRGGRALVVTRCETGGPGLPGDGPGLFELLVLEGGLLLAGDALQVFLVRALGVAFELLPGLGRPGLEVAEVVQVVPAVAVWHDMGGRQRS